jgi:Excreted virulence factor EspC, type VII ESX diderm
MTDTEDRRIAAATIRALAKGQDNAAKGINDATLAAQGVGDNMTNTHGLICAATNAAVRAAEAERVKAGSAAAGIATELAEKLRSSADKYDESDQSEAEKLREQMRPR